VGFGTLFGGEVRRGDFPSRPEKQIARLSNVEIWPCFGFHFLRYMVYYILKDL